MIVKYGYTDGSGDYRITIDEDKCSGCGACVAACPESLFELYDNDYDEVKAKIKDALIKKVGYLCPGFAICKHKATNCQRECTAEAIAHTW